MRLNLLLTLTLAASAYASKAYCNDGTAGDGGCEADKLKTVCCTNVPDVPGFDKLFTVKISSKDPWGGTGCGPELQYTGSVSCIDPNEK
ncbi:hypothetical protein HYFRA_00009744 [Hymenoscyphus fraxineus]|uniref:Hydrophobin n=1 Tax=Hymenoscyphus fraxineus TaxID=746836 RepID=A0A9N9KV86_9HELO|nr:hypothetical protein HYFRA_00009744 [Hymenoscyphus fraxineus]